jgi:hypothetical protein
MDVDDEGGGVTSAERRLGVALASLDGAMERSRLSAWRPRATVAAGDNLDRAIDDVKGAADALAEYRAIHERNDAA